MNLAGKTFPVLNLSNWYKRAHCNHN